MRGRQIASSVLLRTVLVVGAAFSALPFFWMISSSLKTWEEAERVPPTILPERVQWGNYPQAVSRAAESRISFGRCFANSILVAAAVTAGVIVSSSLAGYAFAAMTFPGKDLIFFLFLATLMIPFEVILIPNFLFIRRLGWYDTHAALIVPWTASAFSVFFLRRIFERIPRELYDAARVDGCGHFRFLIRVAVPMARPALVTVGISSFLGSWNAFLWPMIVTDAREMAVVQTGLRSFIQEASTQYHLLMAAAALTILPVVVLYLLAQKWFEQGVEVMQ